MQRVVVFLDYQNVYYGARAAFFDRSAPSRMGNVNVLALAKLLTSKGPADEQRVLQQVRVYRGMPVAERDAKGHAAAWRQREAQTSDADAQREAMDLVCGEYGYCPYDVVEWCDRPLRYPPNYPREKAREKGVDVQLAVDFVSGALAGRFDVGIVMSADNDLYPALEAVRGYGVDLTWPFALSPGAMDDPDAMDDFFVGAELVDRATRPVCEVAAWRAPDGRSFCLRLPQDVKPIPMQSIDANTGEVTHFDYTPPPEPEMRCHWLDRPDYDAVADLTDYSWGEPVPEWW